MPYAIIKSFQIQDIQKSEIISKGQITSSSRLGVAEFQIFLRKRMTLLIELINYNSVHRTAPAAPGLFIMEHILVQDIPYIQGLTLSKRLQALKTIHTIYTTGNFQKCYRYSGNIRYFLRHSSHSQRNQNFLICASKFQVV